MKALYYLLWVQLSLACRQPTSKTSDSAKKSGQNLLIGAFNIQIFGQSKMDKPEVVAVLVKVIQRYDVMLVQEIRDSAQTALPELVSRVNTESPHQYHFVVSPRTGRSSSKEQYGFIYRSDKVKVAGQYVYDDREDVFEREPFVVQFRRLDESEPHLFSYVALHSKPDDAKAEVSALVKVYDVVEHMFGKDVLLAGDFNADCSYVCKSCWDEIDLWTDSRFTWLLHSDVDTTVGRTDCAYDRLVVAGEKMTSSSVNPTIFRFDSAYGLDYEEAKEVSDHYPVEFYLTSGQDGRNSASPATDEF